MRFKNEICSCKWVINFLRFLSDRNELIRERERERERERGYLSDHNSR